MLVLDTTYILNRMSDLMIERLLIMKPEDLVKSYASIATLLSTIIASPASQMSTPDALLRMLPPQVADALRSTMSQRRRNNPLKPPHSNSPSTSPEDEDEEVV